MLEPVYRREGATAGLLRTARGAGSSRGGRRRAAAALRDAADLGDGARSRRAPRAPSISRARGWPSQRRRGARSASGSTRIDRMLAPGVDPKRRAAILRRALADLEVTSEDLSVLAERAAESGALGRRATPGPAIALYRRALVLAALALHSWRASGPIQWCELGDVGAAIAIVPCGHRRSTRPTRRRKAALGELYAQAKRWDDLGALLERPARPDDGGRGARGAGERWRRWPRTTETSRARWRSARDCSKTPTCRPWTISQPSSAPPSASGDADLAHATLKRRAEMAADPRERIAWLEKLGHFDEERRGDLDSAAAAWKRGAILADEAGDNETARRLFWRARKVAPEDHEVIVRLVGVCERAESFGDLPRLYAALADQSADDRERVTWTLRTARVLADRLGDPGGAARAIDAVLTRLSEEGGGHAAQRAELLLARAGAMAAFPGSADDAARTYREILGDEGLPRPIPRPSRRFRRSSTARPSRPSRAGRIAGGFSSGAPSTRQRKSEPRGCSRGLVGEETTFADPARALVLHRRVLAIDPDCDESLTAIARLALGTGETEEALAALRARRDRAAGRRSASRSSCRSPAFFWLERRGRRRPSEILERACEGTDDVESRAQILQAPRRRHERGHDAVARTRRWFERLVRPGAKPRATSRPPSSDGRPRRARDARGPRAVGPRGGADAGALSPGGRGGALRRDLVARSARPKSTARSADLGGDRPRRACRAVLRGVVRAAGSGGQDPGARPRHRPRRPTGRSIA